ncbi:hypothetical protein [Micromonospora sp. MA102]|uniref:hypothetical protein n=1 Tax=Micromonospora sp. MA102 TaxID=2952755 RepID=UPI0021C63866|nr:hypothetical protein [Micromonospora sp. MA102]
MHDFQDDVAIVTGFGWAAFLFALTILGKTNPGNMRVRAWVLNAWAVYQLFYAVVIWQADDGGAGWGLAFVALAAWLRHRARRWDQASQEGD